MPKVNSVFPLLIAKVLFGGEWRKGWFGMFAAYFDASGDAETDSLVVAGFVAPVEQWHKCSKEWQAVLDSYGVTDLHMKHFAHSRRQFESWRGDNEKRERFLASLIALIKRRTSYSFASGVDTKSFKEFRGNSRDSELYSRFESPFALAAVTCIAHVAEWGLSMEIPAQHLRVVFEDGDLGKGNLLNLSSEIFGMNPSFEPKICHNAFQAADLLAYEVFQTQGKVTKLPEGESISAEALRKPFLLLRAMPGSKAWGFKGPTAFQRFIERAKEFPRT